MNPIYIIRLVRPHQWVKNLFVALPLFFSGSLLDLWCWWQTFVAFLSFSLAASAIYCLNDILDAGEDRRHPVKRHRPVASGNVSVGAAYCAMGILVLGALAVCCMLAGGRTYALMAIIGIYLALNVAYCLRLKRHAIIDVFIISFGFVLRLFAGGESCGIWLSPWIVLMTFLVALFLAFAKRRDDVVIRERTGQVTRGNTSDYNLAFLNQTLGLTGAITIVCYIMYTVSPEVGLRMGSGYLYLTAVFVIAGILRYLQMTIVDARSGSPTKILLNDRFIQGCVVMWLLTFATVIYL